MAQFSMKIAGKVAAVTSLFESTPHYFSAYLTDQKQDFDILITDADLRYEQDDADAEAREDGFRRRVFPDPFLERAAIQRKFADYLLGQDIVILHGSTIALDGQGYLFTARSGTGKSTHTRLWRECFGQRAVMVNDDKPFLQITPSGILAYGSPWSGKHGLDSNICVPLKGICLLERGSENNIRPAQPEELEEMISGYRSNNPEQLEAYRNLVRHIFRTVPLWHMYCNKEPQAAQTAWDAMSK